MGKIYMGVSDVAKQIKTPYIGVGGVAKKIKKIYLGVAGVAKKVWQGGKSTMSGTFSKSLTGSDNDQREQVFNSSDYADAIANGHTQFTINVSWTFTGSVPATIRYGIMKQSSQTDSYFGNLFCTGNVSMADSPHTYTHLGTYNLTDLTNQEIWINCRRNTGSAVCDVVWSIEFI